MSIRRLDLGSVSRPGRWRIATLVLVHVAIAVHIVHWRLNGRTLSSVQLSDAGRFAAEGVITAALVLFVALVVLTALFGRVFCSWGCHMLALQEGCRLLLGRLGIRPRAVHFRFLWILPLLLAFHVFFQPAVERLWSGQALPPTRVELTSEHLWANLPGPSESAAAILVGGLLLVYLLGSLSFCKHVCPYGALFAIADKVAPGRIRLVGDCDGCARCTAACTTGTRVHEEVQRLGMVASSDCMRCFECVSSCPTGALAYRFGRPALAAGSRAGLTHHALSRGEEALVLAGCAVTFFAVHGLYGGFPLLVTSCVAVVVAYATVIATRLLRHSSVALRGVVLRRSGTLSRAGRWYLAATAALLVLVAHSAVVQYHEHRASAALSALGFPQTRAPATAARETLARSAIAHLNVCGTYGIVDTFDWNMKLAWLHRTLGEAGEVERHLRRAIVIDPAQPAAHFNLGKELTRQGRQAEAEAAFADAVRVAPSFRQFLPSSAQSQIRAAEPLGTSG